MRLALAGAIFFALVFVSRATSIAPPTCLFSSGEVVSFSVTQSNVVAVYGNGNVGLWDFSSGGLVRQFHIPEGDGLYAARHSQIFSDGQPITLITLGDTGDLVNDRFPFTINIYNSSGNRKQIATEGLVNPENCGCVGNIVILADTPPNNAVVAAIDTGTSRTLWRSETDDDVQTGTIVLADGKCYVNFCRDNCLRARNQSGKMLWKWVVPKGKFAEPGYWPENPALPYVVVYESQDDKDDVADFVALSARHGKTVWRKKNVHFGSLKAVSDDGQHQIFFQRERIEITDMPKLDKTKIIALAGEQDAVFSRDGRIAFCLPSLLTASEDKKNNSYIKTRKSALLSVIAVESGEILKQFSLGLSTPSGGKKRKRVSP